MSEHQYQYPFEPARQDKWFNIHGYMAHMYQELMIARPDLFNETNNTIEKFAAKYPKVNIRTFRYGFVDKVSKKKALNENIPREFIKCNKNNEQKIWFVPTDWCDEHFWNQPPPPHVPEPLVIDVPVVEPELVVVEPPVVEVVEPDTTTPEEEVVLPPNVSIPEPEPDPIPPPTTSNSNKKPPTQTFNEREFYCANDLKDTYPEYFRGVRNKIRTIIVIKKIPEETECVYAMLVKKDWNLSNKSVDKAKLFISKDWCDENMFETSTSSDEEVKVKSKYDMAPPVIEVSDEMMFKDLNGEPIPIEMRGNLINGQLTYTNTYFKVDDISKGFNHPTLYDVIIRQDRDGYIENVDYKKFCVKKSCVAKTVNDGFCDAREIGVKVFLTYSGLVRVLVVSRNSNVDQFQQWAFQILFTHQFGSKEQKQKLAAH